jgi:hypothetical protein
VVVIILCIQFQNIKPANKTGDSIQQKYKARAKNMSEAGEAGVEQKKAYQKIRQIL